MIKFSDHKMLIKEREILKQRLKELEKEGDDLNAKFTMYLRNHREPPAYLREQILDNMSESGRLTLLCYPYTPDEAALKRMEALDLKEEGILEEIKSKMPDMPVAKLAFILPILEESLKAYIHNYLDREIQFRLDCIMTLFSNIYLVYRDSNNILQTTIDEVSDQWIEYNNLVGFGDYILEKLASIRNGILDPTEANILTACVNMSEAILGYSGMVLYEMEMESENQDG